MVDSPSMETTDPPSDPDVPRKPPNGDPKADCEHAMALTATGGSRRYYLTGEDQEEAVEFVASLVGKFLTTRQINKIFRAKYGNYTPQRIRQYVVLARKLLVERYKAPREDIGADVHEFLAQKMRSPETPYNIQLQACQMLIELHGLKGLQISAKDPSAQETQDVLDAISKKYLQMSGVDKNIIDAEIVPKTTNGDTSP